MLFLSPNSYQDFLSFLLTQATDELRIRALSSMTDVLIWFETITHYCAFIDVPQQTNTPLPACNMPTL